MNEIVITSIEDLDERHLVELAFHEKQFQAEILAATNKKRAKKDVKKRRDEIIDRQEAEKSKLLFSEDDQITLEKLCLEDNEPVSDVEEVKPSEPEAVPEIVPQKLSKAAKRRLKKEEEEKANQARINAAIKESEAAFMRGEKTPRQQELQSVQDILRSLSLSMKDIPSDGDCLYHAVAHQLSKFEINENAQSLRVKCANHIRSHPDDFCAFLETDLDTYCNKLVNEKVWGGQIEIMALSASLSRQIMVIQSQMPNKLIFGENYDEKTRLTLTYFRHLFSSGEHYNSVV